jgi:hypothetical protein
LDGRADPTYFASAACRARADASGTTSITAHDRAGDSRFRPARDTTVRSGPDPIADTGVKKSAFAELTRVNVAISEMAFAVSRYK